MFSSWLSSLFSNDLGIDLGTSNTLIYVRGRGIVLTQPSVVARKKGVGGFLKVGKEARDMVGRTPGSLLTIRPLQHGAIADCESAEQMIRMFTESAQRRRRWTRPRVVVAVPLGITQVEKHAIRDSVGQVGARDVYLMEEPLAAAIGAGLPVQDPRGSLVVDIGGGTTEIAVISLAGIVASRCIRIAGDDMDLAIIQYLKRKHGVLVGERTAENVKLAIGSAYPVNGPMRTMVTGRDVVYGVPKTVSISDGEIREAIQEVIQAIMDALRAALEATPAELAGDIADSGIVLTGGGALLRGIEKRIAMETKLPVHVADDPLTCVALGTGKVLDELPLLKQACLEA